MNMILIHMRRATTTTTIAAWNRYYMEKSRASNFNPSFFAVSFMLLSLSHDKTKQKSEKNPTKYAT